MLSTLTVIALCSLFQGGVNAQLRIVNGNNATPDDVPYQVSLQIHGEHQCGGAIIDHSHILTAAHCLDEVDWKLYKAVVGSVNLKNPKAVHQVVHAIVHEHYSRDNSFDNDIAILKVDKPFQFSKFVAEAKLPHHDQAVKDGEKAIISGFGRLAPDGPVSPILKMTTIYVYNHEDCQPDYKENAIRPTNLCARNTERTTGFCKGDSGGPLTVDGHLVGIVSYSLEEGCATNRRLPQIYTQVSKYIKWIHHHCHH